MHTQHFPNLFIMGGYQASFAFTTPAGVGAGGWGSAVAGVAAAVAGGAAELELGGEGVVGPFVGGDVVVVEEVVAAAVDAVPVAFVDDPLLAGGGVTPPG